MKSKHIGILIYIRYRQLIRSFHAMGVMAIFILITLAAAIVYSFYAIQTVKGASLIIMALLSFCISIQQTRKDKKFLKLYVARPYLEMLLEYFIISIPFAIGSLLTPHWYFFPMLLGLVSMVPLLQGSGLPNRTYFKKLSNVTGNSNFELTSGFRKYFMLIIPLYLACLGFSWLKVFPLFLLWILTTLLFGCYAECESLQVLRARSNSPKELLNSKLLRHLKLFFLAYLPVIIINTLFNPDYWLLNLVFVPMQLSVLGSIICLKYSSYQPKITLAGNSIVVMFLAAGAILPFLLPLPFLMLPNYYKKAIKNLSYYYD